jgi:hypothetical protein
MNEVTKQTPIDPLSTEIAGEEERIFSPQNKLPFPELGVDLNEVFPEEKSDLNDLFPDEEIKLLLKKIQRNKKDLHTITGRFIDEDWGDIESDERGSSDEGDKPSNEK